MIYLAAFVFLVDALALWLVIVLIRESKPFRIEKRYIEVGEYFK